jgi:hypothetical protein
MEEYLVEITAQSIRMPVEACSASLAVGEANPDATAFMPPLPRAPTARRRPTDAPDGISDADEKQLQVAKEQAENLGELSGAVYLKSVAKSFEDAFTPAAFQAFRDKFLRDAGDPSDPVEQLMLEQLFLAHHHIGRLHQRAADAATLESARVFYGALCRLQGEFRRLALGLRLYRSPVQPKRFTVVRQQNIAAGDQRIAIVDGAGGQTNKDSSTCGASQLTSNERAMEGIGYERSRITNEPEACHCRSNKPRKTQAAIAGRS